MAIDANGNQVVYTLEDMLSEDMKDAYSELHKDLYSFRPFNFNPEAMLTFFEQYDAVFESQQAESAAELKSLGDRDGIEYRNWSHYYDEKERKSYEDYERQAAEEATRKAEQVEFSRRGSPMPAIEAWMHGGQ